ncbi:MAG: serpin family protein [Blastocatellia bacterium]|nr:serpin family protein [Blastocatellia bacterium]
MRCLRRNNFVNAGLGLLALLSLIACSAATDSGPAISNDSASSNTRDAMNDSQENPPAVEVDRRLVSANTKFGFKLFAELTEGKADENVFISGASVGLALAMTYNGAEGETKKAMARALGLEGMSLDEINLAYARLRASLEKIDPKVRLQIANSLWARRGLRFKPEFIRRNKEFYGAETTELNFDDPNAASTINAWVKEKTGGKIDKIIESIESDAILFLINAIYFKGTWTVEFDKAKTREEDFTLASGIQKKRPMMRQSGRYLYFEGEDFQAVSLPYGEGRASMYIFLPGKTSGLGKFCKGLNGGNWDRWMSQFEKAKGEIVLPRFKLEYEETLNDALRALGMGVAFDPNGANLSGMIGTNGNAFINEVKHKTFVEVNEEGTEAAAATSVGISVTSARPPEKTFRMVIDRPFFCAIRDNRTGTVLFMGGINDPE